ncbi:MAG: T9SS type A sorting domain-containing protein [Saprospiraceae bacterium]|nr:T9SS type A sorting domain-containing protein [Saprospiraceae bacterium]
MRIFLCLIVAFGFFPWDTHAQKAPDFWQRISNNDITIPDGAYQAQEPLKFNAFSLDYDAMVAFLTNAPREFTAEGRKNKFTVQIPTAGGRKETFAIVKTRVMAAELEAQHPEIGTYSGVSLETPGKLLRITTTPGWGFRGVIYLPDHGIEYVEPFAEKQNKFYMAYDRLDLPPVVHPGPAPTCSNPVHSTAAPEINPTPRYSPGAPDPGAKLLGDPINLKVYRFACATTGEFSQDVGGTKPLVFQKVTAVVNQLNGIYERDIHTRLELIAQELDILFLDPNTDPYSGSLLNNWMDQNPDAIASAGITLDQYDIGHVFGKYVAGGAIGIANLGSCCSDNKARGASADQGPVYGDYFIGVVSHEMGHQWSANHTFNQCADDSQFHYPTACEPGSGNSIMSYHGACAENNNNTEGSTYLFYHACSLTEILGFIAEEGGSTCGTDLPTSNTTPEVSVPYPSTVYIPISTPFELTGSATDLEDSNLTYTWDQIDLGPTVPLGMPQLTAPIFRFYPPSASPTRTFPRMPLVVTNTYSRSEILPTYARDITFVLTARDNHSGGGGVAWDTVKLKSVASAGPFLLTYPNDQSIVWPTGSFQTVTWNVANTNKAPINAATVNIKLVRVIAQNNTTTEAVLAENVPNNGIYCVKVPDNITGADLRIRIEAATNVFFDLSDANFSIQPASAPSISICTEKLIDLHCQPAAYSASIETSDNGTATDPITLSASGLPNGATATFEPNPVTPGQASLMTISFDAGTAEGNYDIQLQAAAGALSTASTVRINVVDNDFSAFAPVSPANGAIGVNPQPALKWNKVSNGDTYEVQIATNPSFEPAVMVTSKLNIVVDSFQLPLVLQEGGVYYWRVRPYNECGIHDWFETQVFAVAIQSCLNAEANDLPKNISANGTPTVESKITINAGGTVNDVNITKIQGNHQFFKDLEVRLISPTGTDVLLWKDKCAAYNGNFNVGMDDGAPNQLTCPPSNNGTAFKPTGSLATINSQSAAGVWTLRVKDNTISSGGTLLGFAIELCSNVALNPPSLLTNNPLVLPAGNNAAITDQLLKVEDANNGPDQLIYTLMSLPEHGLLLINGGSAVIGAQFTQADINNGGLRYYDYGLNLGSDHFNFAVTDGDGGLISGTFVVQPTVGVKSPEATLGFELAPNPASDLAVLTIAEPLASDAEVTLYDMTGRALRTWQMPAGAYSMRLDLHELPKGVYAVSIENGRLKGVKKLVVTRF